MPTFEEKYTAWIDGKLAGAELEAFERELDDRPAAEADRDDAQRLGCLLRRHAAAPAMSNADFFLHQLRERMAADAPAVAPAPAWRGFLFSLPKLAWAGAFCLLVAFTIYRSAPPVSLPTAAPELRELSRAEERPAPALASTPAPENEGRVIGAQTGDPTIYATSLRSEKEGISVVWLDGLDYLPASYQLQ